MSERLKEEQVLLSLSFHYITQGGAALPPQMDQKHQKAARLIMNM